MSVQKRTLSLEEIDDILTSLHPNPYIPSEIGNAILENNWLKLRRQLEKIEIYPALISYLKAEISNQYVHTQICAGKCVGIITAQSIGEKQTQSTLNTFHKAGSSERQPVTSKFSELMNTTAKPRIPSYLVYFSHGNETITQLRETIGSSIVQITFENITKKYEICLNKIPQPWYPAYEILHNDDYKKYQHCITLHIDLDTLYTYKITMREIAIFVTNEYTDMVCVYSPDCMAQLDIFVNTSGIELPSDNLSYINEKNMYDIYLENVVYPTLSTLVIKGITGIEKMYFLQDQEKNWFVELEASRVKLVDSVQRFKCILAHKDVDASKIISNNIWDIYHTLGIEAVRQFMIEEFSKLMQGVNRCHITLLVDKMTHCGLPSSISRYSMRGDDSGVLSRASFEETVDNFVKAAVFGQQELINGVSASIICGKRAFLGTGLCDIKMDLDLLLLANKI